MTNRTALADMLAATRLTREGKLQEAAELLQRTMKRSFAGAATTHSAPDADVIDVPYRERDEEDGHSAAGAARENASAGQTQAGRDRPTPGAAFDPAQLQEMLRRFNGSGDLTPSSKHSANHGPGQFLEGEFTNAAGTRRYRLYVPTTYTGQPMPLIVMLHGCKQSPEDFATGTRMNLVAERKGCLVLYPAQSSSANPSGCWNWFKREDQTRGRGEPSILAGMTREMMQRYAVDSARVYAVGLSAGGAMAAVLAVTHPDLYAAVGIHSGLACGAAHDLPSALAAMRGMPQDVGRTAARPPVPTIVIHGDRDRTVHPSNGEQVLSASSAHRQPASAAETLQGRAAGGHAYTRTVHRDASGTAVLESWVVHGGGHAWFGGSAEGSYCDPRGPDASEEISRFLLVHGR